jgi:predicted dehydrogenase
MKRIGFVDYKLDNWHANHFLHLLRDEPAFKHCGWEVAKCWALDEVGGRKWAAEKRIQYVADPREMSDCHGIMILAPSNPETHLALCRKAFPIGKPTYVDKTFAPSFRVAKQIFELADKHHVPVISTSALRCASSLTNAAAELGRDKVRHLQTFAGGGSFEEYIVHPLEMAISVMGDDVKAVMRLADGAHHQLILRFGGGRTANVFLHTGCACEFQAMLVSDAKAVHVSCQKDPFFHELLRRIFTFFETRKESVPRAETLALFRALDVAFNKKALGKFVKL